MSRPLSDDELVEQLKASDTVPEPSPLFWHHAARRVRAAIDAEPPRRSAWWGRIAWAGGGVAAVALAALLVRVPPPSPGPPAEVTPGPALAETAVIDDAPWTLVAELGGELDIDGAAGAGLLAPGEATDRAVQALDQDERTELAALLHRALEGPEI